MVEDLAALRAAHTGTTERGARLTELERLYSERVAPRVEKLGALSDVDLAAAFEATDMLAFYALHGTRAQLEEHVGTLSLLLDAMEARGIVTSKQVATTFDAFVSLRDFASAGALIERYPAKLADREVPRVAYAPHFDARRPAVMALQVDGSLLAYNVDRSGDHVVAIIGCRVSQRALDEIEASEDSTFAGMRTFWLMPADRSIDPALLKEWNARYPGQTATFIHDNAAWTNVETNAMPHFQRFWGERRVASLRGWEHGAGLGQLKPLLDPND